jgi:hypothetical protein
MHPATRQAQPSKEAAPPARPASRGSIAALALCAGTWAVAVINQLGGVWPVQPWLNAAFVAAALLASVAALAPPLPWLNVLLAAGLGAVIGGFAHAINAVTGLPFGRFEFTPIAGWQVYGLVPWWLPPAWACLGLSARGTARLLFHATRSHPFHGYRVIGVAVLLATLPTCGLEAYAGGAARLCTPHPGSILSLASCLALHLSIQIVMTPLLIDKFPGPRPRNFRPLLVWMLIVTVVAAGLVSGRIHAHGPLAKGSAGCFAGAPP